MRKMILRLMVLVLAGGLVLSWTQKAPAQTATPGKARRLIWGSFREGTTIYIASVGLTQLTNKYSNFQSIVQPYPSGAAVYKALHEAKIDVAVQQTEWARACIYNDKTIIKAAEFYPEIRAIMGGHISWWGWLVGADTKAKTIADLKGRTVHYRTPGIILSHLVAPDSLRAVGLDPEKDVRHVDFDSNEASAKGIAQKKVDAIWVSFSSTYCEEAAATRDLVLLPFPLEVFNALRPDVKRTHVIRELPAGYFALVKKQQFVAGWPTTIICRENLPEDVAYQIVKVTMDRAKETVSMHPLFREYGVQNIQLPSDFQVPFHPGAVRYFKEAKMWTRAHDTQQGELLDKLQKLLKAS